MKTMSLIGKLALPKYSNLEDVDERSKELLKNKERRREWSRIYLKEKRKTDINFRIRSKLGTRIHLPILFCFSFFFWKTDKIFPVSHRGPTRVG